MKEIDRSTLEEIASGIFKKNEKTFYIECSLKGTLHYCNKERLDKLVKKVGSLEVLGSTYMSKVAKAELKAKEVKQAPVLKEKKEKVAINVGFLREKDHMVFSKFTDEDLVHLQANWGVCMRQDIVRKERGYCNGCRWFIACNVKQKRWALKSNAPQRTEIREFTDDDITDHITAKIQQAIKEIKSR